MAFSFHMERVCVIEIFTSSSKSFFTVAAATDTNKRKKSTANAMKIKVSFVRKILHIKQNVYMAQKVFCSKPAVAVSAQNLIL